METLLPPPGGEEDGFVAGAAQLQEHTSMALMLPLPDTEGSGFTGAAACRRERDGIV